MRGKSLHALLDRTGLPPVGREIDHPQTPSGSSHEAFPSARAVLGEAAFTIAVFLLIALALQALVVWVGA
ncbi:hypothetical protein [Azospirillum sp. B506]|uniref:hypothetical protein n=1 Tax=Azospirillum sp. B506 TaxID=137721 RepID=UPI0005B2AD78|nr:hypothetical protein [Azospirillum sp. B506]